MEWDLHPLCWACLAQAGQVCSRANRCSVCEDWSANQWTWKDASVARALYTWYKKHKQEQVRAAKALAVLDSHNACLSSDTASGSKAGAGAILARSGIPRPELGRSGSSDQAGSGRQVRIVSPSPSRQDTTLQISTSLPGTSQSSREMVVAHRRGPAQMLESSRMMPPSPGTGTYQRSGLDTGPCQNCFCL